MQSCLINDQWRVQAIQRRGAEVVHFDQCFYHSWGCGIHQTVHWLCKKIDLVRVPGRDRIKLWSWIATQRTWSRFSGSQFLYGVRVESLLSIRVIKRALCFLPGKPLILYPYTNIIIQAKVWNFCKRFRRCCQGSKFFKWEISGTFGSKIEWEAVPMKTSTLFFWITLLSMQNASRRILFGDLINGIPWKVRLSRTHHCCDVSVSVARKFCHGTYSTRTIHMPSEISH